MRILGTFEQRRVLDEMAMLFVEIYEMPCS